MTLTEERIQVFVNGKLHVLRQAATLDVLVDELTPAPNAIATALNGAFVPRNQRHARILQEGDHITCFQLIAGG